MARRWFACLLAAMLGTVAACTGDTESEFDDNEVFLRIVARVGVCEPGENAIRTCGDLLLSDADVQVSAGDETLWSGQTRNDGRVEARFHATGEFMVIASTYLLAEDLTSGPHTPDTTPDVTLTTDISYSLTPISTAPPTPSAD